MIDPAPLRFVYSFFGLFIGFSFLLVGILYRRIKPSKWSMKFGPLELADAIPSLGFAALGVLVIWLTKF